MEDLFRRHVAFTSEIFHDCEPIGSLTHLKKEVEELTDSVLDDNKTVTDVKFEVADCILLLFDFCMRFGISYADMEMAMREKIYINENRKWVKDADGHYRHVK